MSSVVPSELPSVFTVPSSVASGIPVELSELSLLSPALFVYAPVCSASPGSSVDVSLTFPPSAPLSTFVVISSPVPSSATLISIRVGEGCPYANELL